MGACDFTEVVRGEPDAKKAFDRAHNEAAYHHGHGGYSGTIAEKGSYTVVDQTVRTLAQAHAWANRVFEAGWSGRDSHDPVIKMASQVVDDKWGPAAAIPLSFAEEVEHEVAFTVEVDPARELRDIDWEAILRAEGRMKDGDTLVRCDTSEVDDRTRIEARRTEGKAVIRYFYVSSRTPCGRIIEEGDPRTWLSGFKTMAEWRKHATGVAKKYGGRYEAYGITRRFDDEPLDVVDAVVTKRKVTIKAMIARPSRKKLTVEGWMFFGMASS